MVNTHQILKNTASGIFAWIKKERVALVLFLFFVAATAVYLDSVPGLIPDEGLEGKNVFEILHSKKMTILGGPGLYIGPITDYLRVPFIKIFGYTALGLRFPILVSSLLLFWLLLITLRRTIGKYHLFGLILFFFSPIFLGYQRLGWAISLLPFFLFSTIYLIIIANENKSSSLKIIAGLVAGIGASVHFIFIALLPFIFFTILAKTGLNIKNIIRWWVFIVGFIATFMMQATVILLFPADQDRTLRTFSFFVKRMVELPNVLLHAFSGSWFIAIYNGFEIPKTLAIFIVTVFFLLIIFAAIQKKQRFLFGIMGALIIHLIILNYIIGYFTPRYFVPSALIFWCLTGIGIDTIFRKFSVKEKNYKISALLFTIILLAINTRLILIPFLQTGGSMKEFSYSKRLLGYDSFVEIKGLEKCLKNKGFVWSDNKGIIDRLNYLGYGNPYIRLANENQPGKIFVRYRMNNEVIGNDLCPTLSNFVVEKKVEPKKEN